MTKTFKGRVVAPGSVSAKAIVSHGGFNTLASFQSPLLTGDKEVKCSDQNNPDLYQKSLINKALILPETIGSTTGGMVIYTVAALEESPACWLFTKPIDSLAASGAILAANFCDKKMPVIDSLGEEFLNYVKDDMNITVQEDGTVIVEG